MNTRLDAIARRQAVLIDEIAGERDRMTSLIDGLRTQVAIAGLGLLAGRLLRRSRWLRMLAAGGAVVAAALPLLAGLLAKRR